MKAASASATMVPVTQMAKRSAVNPRSFTGW
jgi:hypothetical protein